MGVATGPAPAAPPPAPAPARARATLSGRAPQQPRGNRREPRRHDQHAPPRPECPTPPCRRPRVRPAPASRLADARQTQMPAPSADTASRTRPSHRAGRKLAVESASSRSLPAASAAPEKVIHSVRCCTTGIEPATPPPASFRPAISTSGSAESSASAATARYSRPGGSSTPGPLRAELLAEAQHFVEQIRGHQRPRSFG